MIDRISINHSCFLREHCNLRPLPYWDLLPELAKPALFSSYIPKTPLLRSDVENKLSLPVAMGGVISISAHSPPGPKFSVHVLLLFRCHPSPGSKTQQSRVRREDGEREKRCGQHILCTKAISFWNNTYMVFIDDSFCFISFILPCLVFFVETGS